MSLFKFAIISILCVISSIRVFGQGFEYYVEDSLQLCNVVDIAIHKDQILVETILLDSEFMNPILILTQLNMRGEMVDSTHISIPPEASIRRVGNLIRAWDRWVFSYSLYFTDRDEFVRFIVAVNDDLNIIGQPYSEILEGRNCLTEFVAADEDANLLYVGKYCRTNQSQLDQVRILSYAEGEFSISSLDGIVLFPEVGVDMNINEDFADIILRNSGIARLDNQSLDLDQWSPYIDIPNRGSINNIAMGAHQQEDLSYVISTNTLNDDNNKMMHCLIKFDEFGGSQEKYTCMELDYHIIAFYRRPMVYTDVDLGAYYLTSSVGTTYFDDILEPDPVDQRWLQVDKFDNDLDLIWSSEVHKNGYFFESTGSEACPDGGVIAFGNYGLTEKAVNNELIFDNCFIIKFDQDGQIVSANDPIDTQEYETILYPNPADDWVYISSKIPWDQCQVWTEHGQLMESYKKDTDEDSKIDVSTWPSGIYMITFHNGSGGRYAIRMVKN